MLSACFSHFFFCSGVGDDEGEGGVSARSRGHHPDFISHSPLEENPDLTLKHVARAGYDGRRCGAVGTRETGDA